MGMSSERHHKLESQKNVFVKSNGNKTNCILMYICGAMIYPNRITFNFIISDPCIPWTKECNQTKTLEPQSKP